MSLSELFAVPRLAARHGQDERGQSLVEVTLGFTIGILILGGLIDLGRAYFYTVALEDAAGEAALYLSVNPHCEIASDDDDGTPPAGTCDDPNNARYRALKATGGVIDPDDLSIVYTTFESTVENPVGSGSIITVTVTYQMELFLPIIPEIVNGGVIQLQEVASQPVVTE